VGQEDLAYLVVLLDLAYHPSHPCRLGLVGLLGLALVLVLGQVLVANQVEDLELQVLRLFLVVLSVLHPQVVLAVLVWGQTSCK